MCGFAGFIDFTHKSTLADLEHMVSVISHRGPDDKGTFFIEKEPFKIGLGHVRLSIIDLSSNGHQPMHFNHLSIVFNGEIYNYKELRNDLIKLGHTFNSGSDTEVVLHAYDQWGVHAFQKFIGMFAFCIFNSKSDTLVLCRDRAGVKPFYYALYNDLILIGSELKALMAHPKFIKDIDTTVLPEYLQTGYISAPHTIFKNCYKLEAGHYAEINTQSRRLNISKYWSVFEIYSRPKLSIDYSEAKYHLLELLTSAFNYRMVSDVPVGVFLSGGFDSTAVTSILQSQLTAKLKTFTIGFNEGNNEAPHAKAIAEFLGTDHTELICTTKEAQDIIPTLAYYYDEPFGDSSAIPTILVSRLAAKSVKVALSADAGDEVFCGYDAYFKLDYYNNVLNKVPNLLKDPIKVFGHNSMFFLWFKNENFRHKWSSFFDALNTDNFIQTVKLYELMRKKPHAYLNRYFNTYNVIHREVNHEIVEKKFLHPIEWAMALDYQTYLQDDILTKVDRATMSVSIEGREPLVDHRILEFTAQLPFDFKYNNNTGKRILKDIVYDFIPKEMVNRPKTGFSLPIYSWLRSDLSFLLDEFLSERSLSQTGIFNTHFVRKELKKFRENKLHYSPIIWYLLMFQMWYAEWIKKV